MLLYFQQSSGLGKLMSALHQNASSLVNTKAEHNGPDQILTAADYTSSVRNIPVILRKEEVGLGAEEPLSVPSLLQQGGAYVNVLPDCLTTCEGDEDEALDVVISGRHDHHDAAAEF